MEVISDSEGETHEKIESEMKRLASPGFGMNIDYGSSGSSTIYHGKMAQREVAEDADSFMTFLENCIKPLPRTYPKRRKVLRYSNSATVLNTSSSSSTKHSKESADDKDGDVGQQLGEFSVQSPVDNTLICRGQNGQPLNDEDGDNWPELDRDSGRHESDGETSSTDLSPALETEEQVFRKKLQKDSGMDNDAQASVPSGRRTLRKRRASQARLMKAECYIRYSKQCSGISIIQIGKLVLETFKNQFPEKDRREWKVKVKALISVKRVMDAILRGLVEDKVNYN